MPLISENYHEKKLKDKNINIKTFYIVDNNILERNTDNSKNDDIDHGIRCKKEYYLNNKLVKNETIFDTRIEYSFISNEKLEEEHKCINCGMISKLKDFINGCPYCNTNYNIDYKDKDMGGKYHYDLVLKDKKYQLIVGIIDFIISIIISYFFIKYTSRTFNSVDIAKIFIYGLILSIVLYYFFYIADAYVILEPIKKYKEKINQKQYNFWKKTGLDKKKFFNNLNYEINKKYYSEANIIDFDILDFDEFIDYKKNEDLYVDIIADIRIAYFENGKITTKYLKEKYTLKKINDNTKELENTNVMMCHNCGASIDITKSKCSYCDTEIKYLQDWIIV